MPMSVQTGTKRKEGGFAETVRVIFHALIIALVIRTFLFQPFNITSGSMIPTLLVGDYLFVSKYSYGYTHYSLPFSPPVFSGRIIARPVSRGDLVVFRLPKQYDTPWPVSFLVIAAVIAISAFVLERRVRGVEVVT